MYEQENTNKKENKNHFIKTFEVQKEKETWQTRILNTIKHLSRSIQNHRKIVDLKEGKKEK